MRLKVLLPDGKVQRFPNDATRKVVDGKLTIVDKDQKELASFEKNKWTAVGRMRVASESSDDE